MIKKTFLVAFLTLSTCVGVQAQRFMDTLDRGLIAMKSNSGVYISWRIYGTEYYGVAYNIYRDGVKLNTVPLYVSNFTDSDGTELSKYTVSAVINGVEQEQCSAVSVWQNDYLVIPKAHRVSSDGSTDITNNFEPNDATFADIDGDGQMEVFVKQINTVDQNAGFPADGKDFDRIEVYKLDGTLLWWIECGPNLTDFQHNETNIAVYDWDMDGKAEAIMRAADGTIIHMADGTTYEIGDKTKNYRTDNTINPSSYFIHKGDEFLVYMNGQTGKPYSVSPYPLKRLEANETSLEAAWGDGYGHRSSKNFFGAPYFDGKRPSVFLARGIYTQHKMIALDVNPTTHELTTRWTWNCKDSSSPWYGQGYHNYAVADVDEDGRDEIVFGSMVIDDTGKGLSTTGLGHGDAEHVGDYNPYIHGLEIFACNEDNPANNYRDATTSKIYYRLAGGSDDGRSMAGNFTNDIPGAIGFSGHDTPISCVTNNHEEGLTSTGVTLNFRTYWDGDLLEESFNGIGLRNSNGAIYKYGQSSPLKEFDDTYTNNDTKSTPCFQGDIFGDWREEIAMRDKDNNLRIETTNIPTAWRNYTLLHDPQYRNAMVWQMNGYNQPPMVSYFLGETEGITVAPPPATKMGKEEIAAGGTITSSYNGKQVLLDETGDATYMVDEGVSPAIFFDNAPSWVKGHDDNNAIEYITYKHTLKGGAFTGGTRVVKQGDGELILPAVEQTYSGNTDVWAGTIHFDGKMTNSRVWLNRFATLNSNGGNFAKGIEADYGATIRIGASDAPGTLTTDSLNLNFGSVVEFDIFNNGTSDVLKAKVLKLEKKDWKVGPEFLVPRFTITNHGTDVKPGEYVIAKVDKIEGNLSDVKISGLRGYKVSLSYSDGEIKLLVADLRAATTTTWTGSENETWQLAEENNFRRNDDGKADVFVTGDDVVFEDGAAHTTVTIKDQVSPGSVTFNNTAEYTITGDSIVGETTIIKNGEGTVNITNVNTFEGQTTINAGTLKVTNLGFKDGINNGALGKMENTIILNGGTLEPTQTMSTSHPIYVGTNGGSVLVPDKATLSMQGSLSGAGNMFKEGNGTMVLPATVSSFKLYVNEGVVQAQETASSLHAYPSNVVLNGGTIKDPNNIYSYSTNKANIEVPEGSEGTWYMDERCTYSGKLTGEGILNAYATGPRMSITGSWDGFKGTLNAFGQKTGSYDPEFTFNNAGMRYAKLNVAAGLSLTNSNKAFNLGSLSGSGTLKGSGRYTIGYRDESGSFSGAFSETSFTKVGSGLWTLKRNEASTYNAGIYVKGGILNLSDASTTTTFFGTQSVTVSDSGRLAGKAYIANIYVEKGGILAPGDATSSNPNGEMKGGNIIVKEGGIAFFHANTAAVRTYLTVTGTLTINGKVVLEKRPAYKPTLGSSIILWTCNTFSGTPTVELPDISDLISEAAPYGLKWDISELATVKGTIKVVARTADDVTGISQIAAGDQVVATVYTAEGRYLGKVSAEKSAISQVLKQEGYPHGIYIVNIKANGFNEVTKVAVK
ncbi:rhamnogalacturonan lyase family protein [Segatella bryantii]|uniref:Rhamnogalacturonate lyase n=1 Tax=Segatella bryantii TaxID=77095 RepID=A0ABX4EIR5_SEGBR|nr:autotransporter-associated beta strand repeat-containing protein [Segatella bryantii]MDR4930615.1 autotransporter-associated beta strand repeat-containing protein [Segatella bryantii]OYP56155.1 rhamnogalacturonate lyase [Segatella bryantii]UKK76611.1 autotransporter-associated beta strand repeat-containing protein [Segatella bryantii]UKK81252.1 autotransporter-associated beta strand repeat-containing protein [Segatella bryantii]